MNNHCKGNKPSSLYERIIKPVAAVLVTGLILYFLFGIPAYLLFKEFLA